MKTKIQVLAMMFIAAMAFGACDDDDKNDNIKAPLHRLFLLSSLFLLYSASIGLIVP